MKKVIVGNRSGEVSFVVSEFERGLFWPVALNGRRAPESVMRSLARAWRCANLHPHAVRAGMVVFQEACDALEEFVSANQDPFPDNNEWQDHDVWALAQERRDNI